MFGLWGVILHSRGNTARSTAPVTLTRASRCLQFAGEQANHMHLFKQFPGEFFGASQPCEFIGRPRT